MTIASIRLAMSSDVGLRRKINQDTGIAQQGVFMVCDGMGGGKGGEQASEMATHHLARLAASGRRNRGDIEATLAQAQSEIVSLGERLGGVAGTTITGLILPNGLVDGPGTDAVAQTAQPTQTAQTSQPIVGDFPDSDFPDSDSLTYVVNVGDSRTYHMNPLRGATANQPHSLAAEGDAADSAIDDATALWDASSLTRITRDHSQRQEAIDSGAMLPEEARTTIPRNIITQCLGDPDGISPDLYVADLTGRFIVCSDGLHGEVPDDRIAAIAAAHANPQEAVDALVAAALDAGGTDNITVIVADMPLAEPADHSFGAFKLADGEDIGAIEDETLQTLRTIRSA
jgi:serine/threonine protein phosphatase PrpC